MATTGSPSPLSITAAWDRPLVAATGDEVALLIRIVAPPPSGEQSTRRAPIDVAFVLDRSGSMAGDKLALVKEAVSVALGHLRDDDRAALVIYDHNVETLQPLAATTPRVKAAMRFALHGVDSGGSTNLAGGWLTGCEALANGMAESEPVRIRRALLLTDGLANVGMTNPEELTKHAHELRRRGITTTTLGVGLDFDEVLLSGMAEAGGGNFQFIAHPRELRGFFERELGELLTVVATNLTLSLTLPSGVRAHLISAFPSERQGKRIDVSLRDVSASETICLVFAVTTRPGTLGTSHLATLRAEWTDPAADARRSVELALPPLVLADPQAVTATPVNEQVAEEAALQRAAAAKREAIRLDRRGRRAEARAMMAMSMDYLSAAPQTSQVLSELEDAAMLAEMDATAEFGEEVRKQAMFSTMRRLRSKGDRTT
jgi:Ca-activated chloride channel family protein